jgi:hypothetical protein
MYPNLVRALAVLMIALGVTMIGVTLANGAGVGILLGVLFVVAGAGRLYMLRGRR